MEYSHIPVMLAETLIYLHPEPGGVFLDCTLGGGGYTKKIADAVGTNGKVLSLDADLLAIENFQSCVDKYPQVFLLHGNFGDLGKLVKAEFDPKTKFNGIVFDLGLSSAQLSDSRRGFSFKLDSDLDMAFGQGAEATTGEIVNQWPEAELARILKDYGEERYARKIAKGIVAARKIKPIVKTFALIEIIKNNTPYGYHSNPRIHFATRTFQALRIATNNELENLSQALPIALSLLAPNGRLVVVSYHSLEDRIVKQAFKEAARTCVCPKEQMVCTCDNEARFRILTKKVAVPTEAEVKSNPRARSAKLRAIQKI